MDLKVLVNFDEEMKSSQDLVDICQHSCDILFILFCNVLAGRPGRPSRSDPPEQLDPCIRKKRTYQVKVSPSSAAGSRPAPRSRRCPRKRGEHGPKSSTAEPNLPLQSLNLPIFLSRNHLRRSDGQILASSNHYASTSSAKSGRKCTNSPPRFPLVILMSSSR